MSRVLVAGGRGFMGRRVVRLLRQSLPDVEVLTAGRSDGNDRRLDVHSPMPEAFEGVDVLINTVGPFDYDPLPLVTACHAAGAHYVDIAETEAFIAKAGVKHASLAAVSGASSVPGLIQVFSQTWADAPPAKIRAQLSIGTNNPGSSTLLYCMLRPVGRRGVFGRSWLRDHEGLSPRRYGSYPGGFKDKLIVGGHEVEAEFGFGFDRRFYTRMLLIFAPLVGLLPSLLLRFEAWWGALFSPLARPFGTKIGILSVDAYDDAGKRIAHAEVRAHSDGLDVPAWPAVWAAESLLANPRPCVRLDQLISPAEASTKLSEAGFEVLQG